MSNAKEIALATRQAFRFLRDIHKDTLAAVEALDKLMGEKKWYPTQKNRVSNDLSNGMSADRWLIRSIYRVYVPTVDTAVAERLVAVHINFDPPTRYDHPVCLCVAARFPTPTATAEVWQKWEDVGSERLLEYLCGKEGTHPIEQRLLHGNLLPAAQSGASFVVELCSMVDESCLRDRVVKPLLRAVAEL